MSKLLRAVLIVVLLAVFFLSTWYALRWITIAQIYSYFVETLANATGVNLYLIKAAVLLLLIPFYYGLKWSFSPFHRKSKRAIGAAILTTLAVGYNIGLYFATRQVSFTAEGKPLRYFALTPEGVKYSDRPGVERAYGIPFRPVTPEVARNLKLLEKGEFRPVDPANAAWFNPITGQAQLWYYQYPDGTLEFYDKPGHHPFTNEPLKEVTKQLYLDWREKAKAAAVPSPGGAPATPAAARAEVPRPSSGVAEHVRSLVSERQRRLEEFKALINRAVPRLPGKTTIAMVIDAAPLSGGLSPELAFCGSLQSDRAAFVSNLFRLDLLKAKGFFNDIYQGDQQLLQAAASLSGVDYVVMGRLSYSFRRSSSVDTNLISCDLNLSCRVANREGAVILTDSLSAVGPGFSEEAALENGLRVLSGNFIERILNRIP
ncbi:MAG: alkaline shock response membrane anchor protein AmaP [Kiritimatiellae bacterium]|nr:alkaline shock response membrane anchor protein AmaP [Kiritimatiellia bacterium]